jgi:hypothetical protein
MTKVCGGIKSEGFAYYQGAVTPITKISSKNYARVIEWVRERTAERERALATREEVKAHG